MSKSKILYQNVWVVFDKDDFEDFDEEAFLQRLDEMYKPITSEQVDVKAFVKEMVPTYQPKE